MTPSFLHFFKFPYTTWATLPSSAARLGWTLDSVHISSSLCLLLLSRIRNCLGHFPFRYWKLSSVGSCPEGTPPCALVKIVSLLKGANSFSNYSLSPSTVLGYNISFLMLPFLSTLYISYFFLPRLLFFITD